MLKKMKGFTHAPKNGAGFTLIEVLLVVIILGLLAAVVLPRFLTTSKDTKKAVCRTNIHDINIAWEDKYASTGSAGTLADLLADPERFPDGEPTCPFGDDYAAVGGEVYRVVYSPTHVHP